MMKVDTPCGARHDMSMSFFLCTLDAGHEGRHVADNGERYPFKWVRSELTNNPKETT